MMRWNSCLILLFLVLGMVTDVRAEGVDSQQQIFDISLPVVQIETVNGEMPVFEGVKPPEGSIGYGIRNATKVPARLRLLKNKEVIFDSGDYLKDESGITIRIRGNTTAWAKKKPYKIKLQKKADLLLRGDDGTFGDKDWLLILDESLSAKTGFKLNELAGMQWTPAYEYVNLILNGEYKGLYMLCESVKRNTSCRLDVDKSGYIFEYDPYWWNEPVFVPSTITTASMHYTFKYPDDEKITEEQKAWFTEMIHQAEASIKDGTYTDYIDVNSFVTWVMLHDILGSKDAAGSNYFLTKYDNTAQSKIALALLWDFDMVFLDREKWSAVHRDGLFFFKDLFKDETFVKAYIARWQELSPTIFDQLFQFLEDYANSEEGQAFDASVALDNALWNQDRRNAAERTEGIIYWLTRRKAWMDDAIDSLSASVSGIHSVTADPHQEDAIYNLQGQRISHHHKGIYLKNGKKLIQK